MKNLKLLILSIVLASLTLPSMAAKVKTKSGNLNFLKGQKKFNVVFDWSEATVSKDRIPEEEYIQKRTKEKNEDEPGSGDDFATKWEQDKDKFYHAHFLELLNDGISRYGVEAAENIDAKYTLTLKVIHVFQGHNIGISKIPAYVDFEYIWTETGKDKALCVQELEKAQGSQVMGYDFDIVSRVKESFAVAGKRLASFLKKTLK